MRKVCFGGCGQGDSFDVNSQQEVCIGRQHHLMIEGGKCAGQSERRRCDAAQKCMT